ncbi:uncharacterized protein HD556DRAFT_1322931 [Suillus plorans]|uniref:Uncharacterized protein n=1 Tax=Suillus plorans TaxID=116603 RepID=A0A9P7DYQ2_9AGAM|nr:uncharacterized protein HD556DRAFT_1322931 [Suillus plorans]KAG1806596.1 hypothetical protein HD556DRAFT_1322931 [Suillus plorans]
MPTQQGFMFVRPWDRSPLELPDFADLQDNSESEGDCCTPPSSPSDGSHSRSLVKQEVDDLESRALRLLGRPFGAFLLARRRIQEDHLRRIVISLHRSKM